jgi:molecular chaperone GrpE (heat shock protein)
MDKILARFDVIQFNPLGEKFNPNLHDAVFMIREECDH